MQRGQLLEDEQGCSAAAAAAGRVRRRAEGGRRQRRRRATYLSRPVERTPRLTSLAAVLDGPASGMTAIASDVGRGEGCLPGLAGAGRQQEVGQPACQPARVRPPARPPAAAAALAGKRASAGAGWLSRPCSPIHQTLCHTPPPLLLLSLRLSQSWPPSETFVLDEARAAEPAAATDALPHPTSSAARRRARSGLLLLPSSLPAGRSPVISPLPKFRRPPWRSGRIHRPSTRRLPSATRFTSPRSLRPPLPSRLATTRRRARSSTTGTRA